MEWVYADIFRTFHKEIIQLAKRKWRNMFNKQVPYTELDRKMKEILIVSWIIWTYAEWRQMELKINSFTDSNCY